MECLWSFIDQNTFSDLTDYVSLVSMLGGVRGDLIIFGDLQLHLYLFTCTLFLKFFVFIDLPTRLPELIISAINIDYPPDQLPPLNYFVQPVRI